VKTTRADDDEKNFDGHIRRKINDISGEWGFMFSMECDRCHNVYKTMPARFDPAFETYREAYEAAFVSAVRDFSHNMNLCPVCGRVVCDRCFTVREDGDSCEECAAV
jgi:hypothetical protein